jgi:outer membrane protein TolC
VDLVDPNGNLGLNVNWTKCKALRVIIKNSNFPDISVRSLRIDVLTATVSALVFELGLLMNLQVIRLMLVLFICGCMGILVGCQTNKKLQVSFAPNNAVLPTSGPSYIQPSEPDLCPEDSATSINSVSPETMIDYMNVQYAPISLAECIRRAVRDSEVFRDLGGTLVAQPDGIETSIDPALRFTNPSVGEDAALSAFDAELSSAMFFENNDRPFNNLFSGDTDGILTQDLGEFNVGVSKLAATGTLFTSRSTINFDHNNQAGNRFGSTWEAIIDSGFRHPLLQGSGSTFNRIAGPSQVPGVYNGILIARTNTEISLADFEESVREFVSNVENAYWDLYYSYRELNAQTDARDAAYAVFKNTEAEAESKRISGLERASAEEQYLRFESAIIESMEGRPIEGTQTNSGSSGGSFRRTTGVRVAERRLRYLMGMPITDGMLLQPIDKPVKAPFVFDWNQSVSSALAERPEPRRQRWVLKQKQLELTAAKNFLLPRLDLVGNYRFRGLGKSLTGGGESLRDDINNGTAESGAFSDLASGDFQELQIGAEFRMPVGYRQANAAVRNAELSLQRERAIMKEQERKILLDLSNAIAEARRAHTAMSIAEKRYNAAVEYRAQAAERIESGRSQFDVLLEAQRRILEAQLQFINAEVEYSISLKNVHYERGTFLDYHGVALSESESSPKAYMDYQRRMSERNQVLDYVCRDPSIARKPMESALPVDTNVVTEIPMESFQSMDQTVIGTAPIQDGFGELNELSTPPQIMQQSIPVQTIPTQTIPVQESFGDGILPGGNAIEGSIIESGPLDSVSPNTPPPTPLYTPNAAEADSIVPLSDSTQRLKKLYDPTIEKLFAEQKRAGEALAAKKKAAQSKMANLKTVAASKAQAKTQTAVTAKLGDQIPGSNAIEKKANAIAALTGQLPQALQPQTLPTTTTPLSSVAMQQTTRRKPTESEMAKTAVNASPLQPIGPTPKQVVKSLIPIKDAAPVSKAAPVVAKKFEGPIGAKFTDWVGSGPLTDTRSEKSILIGKQDPPKTQPKAQTQTPPAIRISDQSAGNGSSRRVR